MQGVESESHRNHQIGGAQHAARRGSADALSLTRDCRKTVSRFKVRCMENAKEEMSDALSLTRERVSVGF